MTQREEWTNALHQHEREVERLQAEVRALDTGAANASCCVDCEERNRRAIEYNTAQMIRHEISAALLSSRLASPLTS